MIVSLPCEAVGPSQHSPPQPQLVHTQAIYRRARLGSPTRPHQATEDPLGTAPEKKVNEEKEEQEEQERS